MNYFEIFLWLTLLLMYMALGGLMRLTSKTPKSYDFWIKVEHIRTLYPIAESIPMEERTVTYVSKSRWRAFLFTLCPIPRIIVSEEDEVRLMVFFYSGMWKLMDYKKLFSVGEWDHMTMHQVYSSVHYMNIALLTFKEKRGK